MNEAYFSKVSDTLSWNILKANIAQQKKCGLKPLPYELLAEIQISSLYFEELSTSISKPNLLYKPYAALSVANSQGIWACLLIKCFDNSKNVLLYTAGNIYPLYASIIDL